MVVVNPFDLLDLGDESYDNDEVLFREAEKKALENKKANEAAKEVARFAALRAAAEKEDRDRADAKEREHREQPRAKWKAAKEEAKKSKELSQSPSEKESETSSVNGETKVSRKDKVRKPTIKVFPGDCEKPRLPVLPPRKKAEPVIKARPPSPQSDIAPENYDQISEVEVNAHENGNAGNGNYERPLNRNRPFRKFRNAGVQVRKDEKTVNNAETEGSPLPEESPENNEAIVSEDNKVEVNAEKNDPVVADAAEKSDDADQEKEKKEEEKKEEVETMTYPEYLRIIEEQRKKLPAKPTEERKVQLDSDLQKMKPLPLNKGAEEIFAKLGSEKAGNRKKTTHASGKEAQENGKGEKSVSTEAFFRFPQYRRPQRQFTESDGGKVTVTNGNQSKGRWRDRMEGEESNGSQGHGNPQQYRAPSNENRANPSADRGSYGGQSRGFRAQHAENQRKGSNGHPPSDGGARTPDVESRKDFPSLC